MMILDRDGAQCWNGPGDRTDGQAKTTMIDHLTAALFDHLGQRTIALRVWPHARSATLECTPPQRGQGQSAPA